MRRQNRELAHRHVVRLLDTFEHETWLRKIWGGEMLVGNSLQQSFFNLLGQFFSGKNCCPMLFPWWLGMGEVNIGDRITIPIKILDDLGSLEWQWLNPLAYNLLVVPFWEGTYDHPRYIWRWFLLFPKCKCGPVPWRISIFLIVRVVNCWCLKAGRLVSWAPHSSLGQPDARLSLSLDPGKLTKLESNNGDLVCRWFSFSNCVIFRF